MIIELSSDALLDLEKEFAFYQRQSDGLGAYFISCLTSDKDDTLIVVAVLDARRNPLWIRQRLA